MRVSHRLYLTVVPAVLGVLLVAGLAYWGRYQSTVPGLVVAVATLATVGSAALSWTNARYVAQRIDRLAGASRAEGGPSRQAMSTLTLPGARRDELDAIEGAVDDLNAVTANAVARAAERARKAETTVQAYAAMLASVAAAAAERLEQMRLPLHILLDNHFGELNENQEEMLGAARTAADLVDADVIALRQLAELDLGRRTLRRDRILPGDLVRALAPTLQASAARTDVTLTVDIEPLVPAVYGDHPVLQDAFATLFGDAIRGAPAGAALILSLGQDAHTIAFTLTGAGRGAGGIRSALAERVMGASGGRVVRTDDDVVVRFARS